MITIIVSCSIIFARLLFIAIKQHWKFRRLPPGPTGWPLLGGFHHPSPGGRDWEHWLTFKDVYGPISSITTLGQTFIIFNNATTANAIMDKHANSSDSRPLSVILHDLTGWDRQLSFQANTDIARRERKYMLQALGSPTQVQKYADLIQFEARKFLLQLLETPSGFISHIRKNVGSIILKITYGYNAEPRGPDPLIALSELSIQHVLPVTSQGAWAVEILPILRFLPSCFPGAQVKRSACIWKKTLDELSEKPYKFVLKQIQSGTHRGSYVSRHLESLDHEPSPQETRTIMWTAATMYAAGSDTTGVAIQTFFLAMVTNFEVQQKAQAEIDEVVGHGRLPMAEDLENLPFVRAVIAEVLRWHPVAPLGISHRVTKDIPYQGFVIPEGAILIPNIWAMAHDPDVYRDPLLFDPTRFLDAKDGEGGHLAISAPPDPRSYVFGFGRRMCPGRFLAEATLSLAIMQVLACYTIRKPWRDGMEVDVVPCFLPGLVSAPDSFELTITPRHDKVESLVRAVEADDPWASGDSKEL